MTFFTKRIEFCKALMNNQYKSVLWKKNPVKLCVTLC